MEFELIRSETKDGVLILTMNDPRTRNAYGGKLAEEMESEIDRMALDPELRALVITGQDPSFCSGANVRGFAQGIQQREARREAEGPPPEPTAWERLDPSFFDYEHGQGRPPGIITKLWTLQKPSIAAVNGPAYGIGDGIAISCDFRIASERAQFCEAFIRTGLLPGDGSTWQLPRLIGISNTLMLEYTGEPIDGREAYRIGLANKVVPHEQLMDATMELATKLAHGPTNQMALIKMLVHKGLTTTFQDHFNDMNRAMALARQTEDHKEGVRAFLEKRAPVFKGR